MDVTLLYLPINTDNGISRMKPKLKFNIGLISPPLLSLVPIGYNTYKQLCLIGGKISIFFSLDEHRKDQQEARKQKWAFSKRIRVLRKHGLWIHKFQSDDAGNETDVDNT